MSEYTSICPQCGKIKFFKNKYNARYAERKGKKCKSCGQRGKTCPGRGPGKLGADSPRWTGFKEIPGTYMSSIRLGANNRKIDFSLTIEQLYELFLKQNKKCALTGKPLSFANVMHPGNASLDRKNSFKGYTIDNVQWLDKDINQIKFDYSETEFIEMCSSVAQNKDGFFSWNL